MNRPNIQPIVCGTDFSESAQKAADFAVMLAQRAPSFIKWFADTGIEGVPLVGGKNASLGETVRELTAKGVKVPNGFSVTADAYRHFLRSAPHSATAHEPASNKYRHQYEIPNPHPHRLDGRTLHVRCICRRASEEMRLRRDDEKARRCARASDKQTARRSHRTKRGDRETRHRSEWQHRQRETRSNGCGANRGTQGTAAPA